MYADHVSLVFCLGAAVWSLMHERSVKSRILTLSVIGFALFVPFGAYTGLEIAVAAVGSLSITSIVICTLLLLSTWKLLPLSATEYRSGLWLVVVTGAILYSSTFGFWWFDAYSYGFDNRVWSVFAISGLSASTVWSWRYVPIIVAAVTATYSAQILPSSNWFDYVIDPALWVGAAASLVIQWRTRRVGVRERPGLQSVEISEREGQMNSVT